MCNEDPSFGSCIMTLLMSMTKYFKGSSLLSRKSWCNLNWLDLTWRPTWILFLQSSTTGKLHDDWKKASTLSPGRNNALDKYSLRDLINNFVASVSSNTIWTTDNAANREGAAFPSWKNLCYSQKIVHLVSFSRSQILSQRSVKEKQLSDLSRKIN